MVQFVGILNITPDSFYDGGSYLDVDHALEQAGRLVSDGADIIDIGAESTRPGGVAISAEEEWQRLEPILRPLSLHYQVSVDTRNASTAAKAIEAGAFMINDVSGFSQQSMIDVVRDTEVQCVIMHSLTIPVDRHIVMPDTCDVVEEVILWGQRTIDRLVAVGIDKERVIIDPGIGFGKTAEQSWRLIHNIEQLRVVDVPLYVGHSMKSFMGGDIEKRIEVTCDISKQLAQKHIEYLRVHDVAANKKAVDSSYL